MPDRENVACLLRPIGMAVFPKRVHRFGFTKALGIKRPVLLQIRSLSLIQHRALFPFLQFLCRENHILTLHFSLIFQPTNIQRSPKCLQSNPQASASSAPNLSPTITLEFSIPPSEVLEWLQRPGQHHPTLPRTSDTQHQYNTTPLNQMPSRRRPRIQIPPRLKMLFNNSKTSFPHILLPTPRQRSPPPFQLCSPSFAAIPQMPWTGQNSHMQMPQSNIQET